MSIEAYDEYIERFLSTPNTSNYIDLSPAQLAASSVGEAGYESADVYISLNTLPGTKWAEEPPVEFVEFIKNGLSDQ